MLMTVINKNSINGFVGNIFIPVMTALLVDDMGCSSSSSYVRVDQSISR